MGIKDEEKGNSDSNVDDIQNANEYSDSDEKGNTMWKKKDMWKLAEQAKGKKKRARKRDDDDDNDDKENDIEMVEKSGDNSFKRRNSAEKEKRFLKSKIKERGIFKKNNSFNKGKKKVVAVSSFLKNKDRKSTREIIESPRKEFPPPQNFEGEKVDVYSNGIVDGIGSGKDKMMWARRAFFMSTEKIFPGFIRNYGLRNNRSRDPTGVKLRTSIPLKMCLLAHSYFVPIWFIGFLFLQEYATSSLKPIHSYVHTSLAYACMIIDVLRLYGGFVSNTTDDMQLLALYWMATVILQTPMLCFVFATHSFSVQILPMNVAMDVILACILVLEIWFGFWQLKGLVSSEMNLLHLARQVNEMDLLKDYEHGKNNGIYQYQPRVVNDPHKGPYLDWSNSSRSERSSNSSGQDTDEEKTDLQAQSTNNKRNNKDTKVQYKFTKKSKKKVKSSLIGSTDANTEDNYKNNNGSEHEGL